ncbi:unnamed protein product [Mytilus coruscus]|uniref:Exonuclease domain-containing protein n=1 Tax=Mytilus coruscus TaxID=42192 RepID=A0A6J8C7M3_MYTCO|nr:unnamed protein product [Mytilus coruscus]
MKLHSYIFTLGHATVIGNLSGKCLHFGLKSTDCRKCNYIDEKGDANEKDHDCRRNYSGSSLSMETNISILLKCENTNKLANLGSSQSNESLNYFISTKAPKSKHFGGSQSLGYRVASAISQKNEDRNYVVEVNKTHSLSPCKFKCQQREHLNSKRKREKAKATTPAFKRKRRDKKGSRVKSVRAKEIREGDSYSSAISCIEEDCPDIEEIPLPAAENDNINSHLVNTATVFFDLETTGLGISCDITQITAVFGTKKFSQYVMPQQPITPAASKVTGLTRLGNILYRNGIPVPHQSRIEFLKELITWLPENAVLFGNNVKSFDSRIIIKALKEENLIKDFKAKCKGFVDTLHVFRAAYPKRKIERKSFKQEELVKDFLGESVTYDVQNALGDVLALQELLRKAGFSLVCVQPHSFSIDFAFQALINVEMSNRNYELLKVLPISAGMTKRMAKSGLNIQHLKLAFRRGGVDGVYNVMSEEINGKVRVTKNRKILVAAAQFIKDEIANIETVV